MAWSESTKVLSGAIAIIAACMATTTGYVQLGGPIPATRTYVQLQIDSVKNRLIDNSIQTNRLQLDLLRREQVDRLLQSQHEKNANVRSVYQERLNTLTDEISDTVNKNGDLEKEKQRLGRSQ